MALSQERLGRVRTKQKSASDLPVIYNRSTDPHSPISRTYEAQLILTPNSAKVDGLKWLDKAIEAVQESNADRNELYSEFLNTRKGDNESQLSELDRTFRGVNDFREGFTVTGIDSEESGQMFSDLSAAFGPMQSIKDVQDHAKALLALLEAREAGRV
jgi:hypothetical protein